MTSSLKAAFTRANSDIKGRLDGNYQREGVKWMLGRELDNDTGKLGGILADDMGLGKTMQAIATMRGNPKPTLIISIVGTLAQWRDALIQFGGFQPVIINPSFQGILPDDIQVAITTYSSFQCKKTPICLFQQWGRIILDEGHIIRNPTTRVCKEIFRLSAPIKWILTGTPIQNSQRDINTLAQWIGVPKGTPVEDITETYLLRRTQEQQEQINPRLALPPLETHVMRVQFTDAEEKRFYYEVEKYYSQKTKNAIEAMEAFTRCRQACCHPMLYEEGINKKKAPKKKRKTNNGSQDVKRGGPPDPQDFFDDLNGGEYHSSKLEFLVNHIAAQLKGTKSLVFCQWIGEMRSISNKLKEKSISSLIYDGNLSRDNKEATLYNFKNTSIPVLIIQITCGSTGLNLQCASRVYITSPSWNPCTELQAIGRAYRKGQTSKVICIRLVMAKTVEERCIDIQDKKLGIISDAMMDESLSTRLWGKAEDDILMNDEEIDQTLDDLWKSLFDDTDLPVNPQAPMASSLCVGPSMEGVHGEEEENTTYKDEYAL